MKDKMDYLNELEIAQYFPEEIIKEVKVERFKKGDIIVMEAFHTGNAWRIVEGSVKVTIYPDLGQEFNGEFKTGEWIGVASILTENVVTADMEAREEVVLLTIPLRKMIDKYPDIMANLWERIAKGASNEFIRFLGGTLAKAVMTNEGYFLRYLDENGRELIFENTKELSELVNTNLRTLQRIIKKLKEEGIIEKSRKAIRVIDHDKFEDLYSQQMDRI